MQRDMYREKLIRLIREKFSGDNVRHRHEVRVTFLETSPRSTPRRTIVNLCTLARTLARARNRHCVNLIASAI